MKDSQREGSESPAACKYIKVNNERFSTQVVAGRSGALSISR